METGFCTTSWITRNRDRVVRKPSNHRDKLGAVIGHWLLRTHGNSAFIKQVIGESESTGSQAIEAQRAMTGEVELALSNPLFVHAGLLGRFSRIDGGDYGRSSFVVSPSPRRTIASSVRRR